MPAQPQANPLEPKPKILSSLSYTPEASKSTCLPGSQAGKCSEGESMVQNCAASALQACRSVPGHMQHHPEPRPLSLHLNVCSLLGP